MLSVVGDMPVDSKAHVATSQISRFTGPTRFSEVLIEVCCAYVYECVLVYMSVRVFDLTKSTIFTVHHKFKLKLLCHYIFLELSFFSRKKQKYCITQNNNNIYILVNGYCSTFVCI